jgi:hypothetical protein
MKIRIIATGQEGEVGELFPNVSFGGGVPTQEWLTSNGCEEVIPPAPTPYVPTIFDQIAELEATITRRMQREALIGSTLVDFRTGKTAAQQIADIDAQIATLRSQL